MDTKIKTREEVMQEIISLFESDSDLLSDVIEDLDLWNGYLGDDRWYYMDELPELLSGKDPMELLCMAFYGDDLDSWTLDSNGEKDYGSFCPNREYFKFNGYGNLVSSDWKDYSDFNDHWLVEAILDNRIHLDSVDDNEELSALLDELESILDSES